MMFFTAAAATFENKIKHVVAPYEKSLGTNQFLCMESSYHQQPMSVYPRGQFFQHRINDYWSRACKVILRTTRSRNVELLEVEKRMLECTYVEIIETGPHGLQRDTSDFAARLEDSTAVVTGQTNSPPIYVLSFSVVNEGLEQGLAKIVHLVHQRSCDIVYVEVKCNLYSTESGTIHSIVRNIISKAFNDLDLDHQLVVALVTNRQATQTPTPSTPATEQPLSQIPPQQTIVYKRLGSTGSRRASHSPTKIKRLSFGDDGAHMPASGSTTEQLFQRQQYSVNLTHQQTEPNKHYVSPYKLGQAVSYQIEDKLFRILESVENKLKTESEKVEQSANEGQISTVDKMLFEIGGIYNQGQTRVCQQKKGELKPQLDNSFKIDVLNLNEKVVSCGRLYGKITIIIQDILETELSALRDSVEKCLKKYNLEKETFVIQGMVNEM